MNIQKKIEGTYFDSAFQTGSARLMPLAEYIGRVKNSSFAPMIAHLRALIAAGKSEEAVACKRRLPLYVAGGVMQGGRRLEHLVCYSGCVVVDIDHSPVPPSDLLLKAGALPYVKAGHISPSGRGVKLFVPVDSGLELHRRAFETVRRYVEVDLPGVVVDISGKDPNRGCFVSHDPTAFYKEVSEVMEVTASDPSLSAHADRPTKGEGSARRLAAYIDRYEQDNPFATGSRHAYVVKLASALNHAGFSLFEAISESVRRYARQDFSAGEVEKTVTDIYRRYSASHGEGQRGEGKYGNSSKTAKTAKTAGGFSKSAQNAENGSEGADIEPDLTHLPLFDDAIFDKLPPILTDILKNASDPTERDVLLISSLTLLSSVMTFVEGSLRERIYSPALYTIVTGRSGSGKGCMADLYKLLSPWHEYVYECSRSRVEEYEVELEAYEAYKQQKRQKKGRGGELFPVVQKPKEVKQKNLFLTGQVTQARLVELLGINSPFISCMIDTEMETIVSMFLQDFGKYSDILNKAAHHEAVGSSTKHGGSFFAQRPNLALLWSGTPAILPRLIPSTENGLFSRMLMYKIPGGGEYRCLTSADDAPTASEHLDAIGLRVLEIGKFLEKWPTWVRFSDSQRKRLDRFFRREYYNVRSFGNEDMESTVLRYRQAIFRIAMTLTGLRKATSGSTERKQTIRDDDFDTAFNIGCVSLQHAYVVSTSLQPASGEVHFKFPHHLRNLFAALPESFKRSDMLVEAAVREITDSSVDKLLKKLEINNLITSMGGGYYRKTESGKQVVTF